MTTIVLSAPVPVRRRAFSYRDATERAAHVAAFLAWLPPAVRAAPAIDWEQVPSPVMGYLMTVVADSPDAAAVALATGSAQAAVGATSLYQMTVGLAGLLRRLREQADMTTLADLEDRTRWEAFVSAAQQEAAAAREDHCPLAPGLVIQLGHYQSFSHVHLPTYLERIETSDPTWHRALRPYVLPPMPPRFLEQRGLRAAYQADAQRRRKEQADVLTPLHSFLVQVAQFRKQAVEALIVVFRAQCARAQSGEVALPHRFTHQAQLPVVDERACTVAALDLTLRPVTLAFTLWDRRSWAQAHHERLSAWMQQSLRLEAATYAAARNGFYLEYHGAPADLYWFGSILAVQALGKVESRTAPPARVTAARGLGEAQGCFTARPGLLNPDRSHSGWLASNRRLGEIVFEPESLYRGVLYAAALATVALTSGCRVSELLQVSNARWDVSEIDEQRRGHATGRRVRVVLQQLLPKGSRLEAQRQPYLMSPQAVPLLVEIGRLLEQQHGQVPVVPPNGNTKQDDLKPEPYLFQWGAEPGRHTGLLGSEDVGRLLRFLFFGLNLTTAKGHRIRIATHLCRHVFATSARHTHHVPAEALAWMLHHRRVPLPQSGTPALPAATAYYSELPREQQLALLHDAQVAMATTTSPSALHPPTAQELSQLDEELRAVFENWGTIGPVTFGWCKAGMCVRPHHRALCIGCPFLVEDYRRLGSAQRWHAIFMKEIELLEDEGHRTDAVQKRRDLAALEGHLTVMRLQRTAVVAGRTLPSSLLLSLPEDEEERDD